MSRDHPLPPDAGPGACAWAAEAISARFDGELAESDAARLDAHLARCVECRALAGEVDALDRVVRLRPAEAVPDLVASVLARVHPPRPGRRQWVRFALAWVALTEIVLGLPALVLGDDPGASTHVARHVGSLTIAVAIGLLYAAWRPVRAFGLLPMVASLAALSVVTAVIDTTEGNVAVLAEAHHVLEMAGLVLLWMLAGRPRPRRVRRAAPPAPTPPMRVV